MARIQSVEPDERADTSWTVRLNFWDVISYHFDGSESVHELDREHCILIFDLRKALPREPVHVRLLLIFGESLVEALLRVLLEVVFDRWCDAAFGNFSGYLSDLECGRHDRLLPRTRRGDGDRAGDGKGQALYLDIAHLAHDRGDLIDEQESTVKRICG